MQCVEFLAVAYYFYQVTYCRAYCRYARVAERRAWTRLPTTFSADVKISRFFFRSTFYVLMCVMSLSPVIMSDLVNWVN